MVTTTSMSPAASRYQSSFSNGTHAAHSDATPDKGGAGLGFRPHELLEAALGTCMNMHLRMYADHHGISLGQVTTVVTLDRTDPLKAGFQYSITMTAPLSPEETEKLLRIAATCPVHNTLSRQIVIQPTP